ncbi:zinc finger CCCH domain-containing protein 54 [Cinnamomum micranthum f. kanehirae]|uniref:Zinc finger CCCH domain-containing protein 54 n=1 Tax=Cinnamomum micranthum f. kanehirae TaxID=337451 RepID=A0A3S3MII1_9MAGN|nr:zinc finger CCCH domain-containing protein 54 [Cinnamomum micranthum f. kanehirae]
MLKGLSQSLFEISKPRFSEIKPTGCFSNSSETVYETDEFRMYTFKIKWCNKTRTHDWTECPYAHRGEKARRRDPRKFNYYGVTCPEFRRGGCPRGDSCEFAHGVFEFWLHPERYRTRACTAGQYCRRKVCFFAHTPEQLRIGSEFMQDTAYHRIYLDGLDGGGRFTSTASPENEFSFMGDGDFVVSMAQLKMDDGEELETCLGGGIPNAPDIDWISELVRFE